MKAKIIQPVTSCMLRSFLGLFFLLFVQSATAQLSYGFGLRTHVGGMQAYKDVKGYYNDMRPWLKNDLGTSARMIGLEFGLEASYPKGGFAFVHIYGMGANASASGTNNGIDYKRKIKARMWGIETVDAWYTPLKLGSFNVGGGLMPFGLGIFRVKTNLNGDPAVKVPLSDLESLSTNGFIFKTSHVYAQVHLDVTRTNEQNENAFHFQFFYTIGPKREYDLFYLNQEINPTTYTALFKRTLMKMNNFGLKLMYSF